VNERQLYTFTNKFGNNKFVPVNNANLAKPAIKTYSKISDHCEKKTKKKTDPKQNINTSVNNTTSEIENCKSNTNEKATVVATITVPVTNVKIPVTTTIDVPTTPVKISVPTPPLESSFPLDLQPMEEAPAMLLDEFVSELTDHELQGIEKQNHHQYLSDEGYSESISGNSSPTSGVEDYATLHAMEPEDVVTTNPVPELPELHIPEVEDFHLDSVLLSGDIEMDLLDSNLVSEKDQDMLYEVDNILLGTFDSIPDMLNAFSSEKVTSDEEQPKTDNASKRHRKGPIRQNLEDLPAENRGNVQRCREYRLAKKEKELNYIDELNALESKNNELVLKEQRMKEELVRMQEAYLKLISEGRIKFA